MTTGTRSARGRRLDTSVLLLGAVLVAGAAIVAWYSRHLTFSGDDWELVLMRRGHSASVFLTAHGQHLIAGPILVYKVLLHIFGASSYWPFMAVAITLDALCAALLYVLARRRIGPWAALVPAAILIVLGPAWQDLLWAFQMGFLGSIAAGLGALLLLERGDRRGDAGACALLVVSLAFGSMGIGFLFGVLVELLLGWRRRDDSLRRLWVVAVPLVLYGLWYLGYGEGDTQSQNVWRIPAYIADSLAASLGSITGLAGTAADASPYVVGLEYGRALAVAALAWLAWRATTGLSVSRRLWTIVAAALLVWIAAALSYYPGREPEQSRYQYLGAVLVLLAVIELARGWRPSPRAGTILAIATVAILVSNVGMLRDRAAFWAMNSDYAAAETGAIEVARDSVAPDFQPEDAATTAAIGVHNLAPLTAGAFLSGTASFGSPADSQAQLLRQPEAVREATDFVLAHAERLGLTPIPALPAGLSCRRIAPTGGTIALAAPSGTFALRAAGNAAATVSLRRFADAFRFVVFPVLAAGQEATFTLPADRAPTIPWHVQIATAGSIRLCS